MLLCIMIPSNLSHTERPAVSTMNSMDKNVLDQLLACDDLDASKPASQEKRHLSPPRLQELADCPAALSAQIEAEIIDLFDKHASALGRYAESLIKDGDMAQDAIQEAFLRYFKTRTEGSPVENPHAWLFRVLRNHILDQIRKNRSIRPVELDALDNIADVKQDIEAKYAQNEVFRLAVSVLSPRERECIQLRLEGFGYDEIAQILQIRARSVGALLTRSLNKIRKTGIFSGR